MNAFSSLILFVFQGLQENSTSRECNVGTYFIFRDIRLKTPQKKLFFRALQHAGSKKTFFSRHAICRNEIKHFFQALQIAGSKKTFFQSHAICRKQKKLFFGPCRLQRWKKTFFSRQKFPETRKNIFFRPKVLSRSEKTFFSRQKFPETRKNIFFRPKLLPRSEKTFFSRQKFPEDEKNIFFPSKVPRGPKKTFFPHTQIPQGRRKIKYTLYNIYIAPRKTPQTQPQHHKPPIQTTYKPQIEKKRQTFWPKIVFFLLLPTFRGMRGLKKSLIFYIQKQNDRQKHRKEPR